MWWLFLGIGMLLGGLLGEFGLLLGWLLGKFDLLLGGLFGKFGIREVSRTLLGC